jgi:hypothetical protein
MLRAPAFNFVPIAVEAGVIALLKDVLWQDCDGTSTSISSLRAAMTCLRVITNTSLGVQAVVKQPDLCQAVVAASTAILEQWFANKDQLIDASSTAMAAEIADTLHVLANLITAGTFMKTAASAETLCMLVS